MSRLVGGFLAAFVALACTMAGKASRAGDHAQEQVERVIEIKNLLMAGKVDASHDDG
jgi:hypothetical protein